MSDDGISKIADDIIQVQIPLPYVLNIVNCYLLRGGDGWTLVDTGLNTAAARSQWKSALASLGIEPADIEKIVLTHMHPDHFGMAGWWQRQTETPIPLYLPEREARQMRIFYQPRNTPLYHRWLLDCGLDEAAADNLEGGLHSTRDLTQPHPVEQEFLTAGVTVRLGAREFRAIHAPGHSDGQMIFYDAADKLMLCGDHVLMRITPNIGVWPHSEAGSAGALYGVAEGSLARIWMCGLALPGHKWLIQRLARADRRIDRASSEQRLALTEAKRWMRGRGHGAGGGGARYSIWSV